MSDPLTPTLTIGRLAKAADVGIETIRYYQTRGLLPLSKSTSGYRQYPVSLIGRIRFIKRAQALGWTLEDIASLLQLEDGTNRRAIRSIARKRITQIDAQLADLARMRQTLAAALVACVNGAAATPCPIIDCLAKPSDSSRLSASQFLSPRSR